MQDRLVSLLIFSIVLSGLIDIGYCERTFDVLNYRAVGDGEADDSEVTSLFFFFVFTFICFVQLYALCIGSLLIILEFWTPGHSGRSIPNT